jgi:hypothetical protein
MKSTAHLHVRELALAYAHDHPQLLLAQHNVLIIVCVIDGAQRLAAVVACKQLLQLVSPLLLVYLGTLQCSSEGNAAAIVLCC